MEKWEHSTAVYRLILGQKGKGEISKKIFLRENTDLNGNKGSCNSKEGKALSDSEYMLPMK